MDLLTKTEVCKRLNLAPRTIENMVNEGRFPPGEQIGKRVYWADEVVDKWRERKFKKQLEWEPRC